MYFFRTAFWLALFIVILSANSRAPASLGDQTTPQDQTSGREDAGAPPHTS